jgi:hypothetical protein
MSNCNHCWHPAFDELGFDTKYQRCCLCPETRDVPSGWVYGSDQMTGRPLKLSHPIVEDPEDVAATGPWGEYDM